jgi:hypothetical protein
MRWEVVEDMNDGIKDLDLKNAIRKLSKMRASKKVNKW